jgi:hypothetical protein
MFLEYCIRHFSWIISQIFVISFLKVSVINSAQRKDFQSLGKKDSNIIELTKFRYFGFLSSYASFYSLLFYFFATFVLFVLFSKHLPSFVINLDPFFIEVFTRWNAPASLHSQTCERKSSRHFHLAHRMHKLSAKSWKLIIYVFRSKGDDPTEKCNELRL